MEQIDLFVKINNSKKFLLILNIIKELTHNNIINMIFEKDGIYFNEINYLYSKNNFNQYICLKEISININFFSIDNTDKNVLYFILTKKEKNKFKIIEKYDIKTNRQIIKINNKRKLIT